jgi:hypothetical protein
MPVDKQLISSYPLLGPVSEIHHPLMLVINWVKKGKAGDWVKRQ